MTDYFPTYVQGCAAYWASCDAEKKNGTTEGAERSGIAAVVAALLAERPQSGEMVMVPRSFAHTLACRLETEAIIGDERSLARKLRDALAAAEAEREGK